MADPKGFLKYTQRETPQRRPVPLRLRDWKEVYEDFSHDALRDQAARCMDCGIPFCHNGCPLGNLIPEWNDLVRTDRWRDAIERLHATNNFPEFTGRLCPAPCEGSCVLGINQDPVTIKQVEVEIIDNAFDEGWVVPLPPDRLTGKTVAVVGSGPGRPGRRAAADPRRAHRDGVRARRPHRRPAALRHPRVQDGEAPHRPAAGADGGRGHRSSGPASTSASTSPPRSCGPSSTRWCWPAARPRGATCRSPAASSTASIRRWSTCRGPTGCRTAIRCSTRTVEPPITAKGKKVIIIGGGDTGADCLGTAHRQGAASVHQFEIMPRPPETRADSTPWPTYPLMFRVSSAHEEGGERVFSVNTEEFAGSDGRVTGLRGHEVAMNAGKFEKVEGTDFELEADLVLLAMGFVGPEREGLLTDLGVEITDRGNVARDADFATTVPGVFVAGDMGRGQSLIVWAIAEGRAAAAGVDRYLMGQTALPAPIKPTAVPQR